MPTFKEAFKGNKDKLGDKLDVNNTLLRKLVDQGVLPGEHGRRIKQIADVSERVDELLEILERRDDSLFDRFCEVLVDSDQHHVVTIIRPTREHPKVPELIEDNQRMRSPRRLTHVAEAENMRYFSNECLKHACLRNHDELITSFVSVDIIDYLFTQDVITRHDSKVLNKIPDKTEQCEQLMLKLNTSNNNKAFIYFHRGLRRNESSMRLANSIDRWCLTEPTLKTELPVPVPVPVSAVTQLGAVPMKPRELIKELGRNIQEQIKALLKVPPKQSKPQLLTDLHATFDPSTTSPAATASTGAQEKINK